MKLKMLLNEISSLEVVELVDKEFRLIDVCFENTPSQNKDVFKNFGELEIKCIFTSVYGDIKGKKSKIVISLDFECYEKLSENSFRYKENVYSFYHLQHEDRLVIFKENVEEVDTFIDWFHTSGENYEALVQNCINYIKRKGDN